MIQYSAYRQTRPDGYIKETAPFGTSIIFPFSSSFLLTESSILEFYTIIIISITFASFWVNGSKLHRHTKSHD